MKTQRARELYNSIEPYVNSLISTRLGKYQPPGSGGSGGSTIPPHQHDYVTDEDLQAHIDDTDPHPNETHDIAGGHHTTTGAAGDVLGRTATNTLGFLTPTSDGATNHSTILKSSSAGGLTLDSLRTPLIDTGSGNLLLDPAGDLTISNDVEVRSATFTAPNPFTVGYSIHPMPVGTKHRLQIGRIEADELIVKLFTADETRVRRASDWLTPTFAVVAADDYGNVQSYTMPAEDATVNIWFHDSEHTAGALFTNQEWVMMQFFERDSGLVVLEIWGQVATYYTDPTNRPGLQRWTFTNRTADVDGFVIRPSQMFMGFGSSGDGWIYRTVLGGGPRAKYAVWSGSNPRDGTVTTKVQIGDLSDAPQDVFEPDGYGLYAENAFLLGDFYAAGGDVVITTEGSNWAAATADTDTWTSFSNKLTWTTDPMAPAASNTVAQAEAIRVDEGAGQIRGRLRFESRAGVSSALTDASIDFYVTGTGDAEASIAARVDNGDPYVQILSLAAGTLRDVNIYGRVNFLGGLVEEPVLLSSGDGEGDIGSVTSHWRRIYVDEIIGATVIGSETLTGAEWAHVGDLMVINASKSDGDSTVQIHNDSASYRADLLVEGHISLGGNITLAAGKTVDGVDVSEVATELGSLQTTVADHEADDINTAHLGSLNWARVNKTFSSLGDLETRNYSQLNNRGHALASTTGLGSDHTVSGLTDGQVLRAASATTARFEQLAYSDLGSRDHVLADTSGLGDDHTVSGLTAGYVLRATGATTAKFMQLSYSDLGSRTHVLATAAGLGGDHSVSGLTVGQVLRATGATTAKFDTIQFTDLGSAEHNLITYHDVTAPQYSVLSTWAGADTLGMTTAASNGVTGHVLLKTDANGDLQLHDLLLNALNVSGIAATGTIYAGGAITTDDDINVAVDANITNDIIVGNDADITGTATANILVATTQVNAAKIYGASNISFADGSGIYGQVNAQGIRSVIPSFVSGINRAGLNITWQGDADLRDVKAVNLSTFVFTRHRVSAVGGILAVSTSGKLYDDATFGALESTVTFQIDDEDNEGELFEVGNIVRFSGLAYAQVTEDSSAVGLFGGLPFPFFPFGVVQGNPVVATAFVEITSATANTGYIEYEATYKDGPENIKYLKGTGCALWSGGMIVLQTSGDAYTPFIDIFDPGDTPWVSGTSTHYARIGRIDGLGVVSGGEQYGFVFSADADDATAARIVGSSLGTFQLFKTGIISNDGTYNTFTLDPDGTLKLGSNVDAEATTFIEFDPSVDEGAYASLIVRARLQSSIIELPQGEIAVYTATDLFDAGYGDFWASRMNRYGFQIIGGLPDAYTTDSAGVHRFTDQGYEIRINAEADVGTPSVYPIFRLTGTGAGNMASYVPDTDQETGEITDFGSYDWTEWSYNDPIVKFLAMFAPDAIETDQLYSSQAQLEFGTLNLETGEELRAFTIYGDSQSLSRMQVVADELYIDSETLVSGSITIGGDFILHLQDAETGEIRKFIWRDPPTSAADAAAGEVWVDPSAGYVFKWNPT